MFKKQSSDTAIEYEPSRLLASCFEWVSAAIVALVTLVLLFAFAFRMVNVDGTSMNPTLNHGERLLISGFCYTPDYGDVVVVLRENDTPLIKRVIGLTGDTISIDKETGVVYRNGVALDESYVSGPTALEGMSTPVTVAEGELFVMGDNRVVGRSLDSRRLGCVSTDDVIGRVLMRIAPEFGLFTNGE